jgi:hypothetical protein
LRRKVATLFRGLRPKKWPYGPQKSEVEEAKSRN